MTLKDLLRHGGRKYAVVIRTLELGFLLSLLGLLVIAVVPAVAVHVGTVLGSFGLPLATAGVWCVAAWEVRAGSPETQEG